MRYALFLKPRLTGRCGYLYTRHQARLQRAVNTFCIKEYEILPKSASPEIAGGFKNDKM
jgi:hypothetical protein